VEHRKPATEIDGLSNRLGDAVTNAGHHRTLALAVISTVVVTTTAFYCDALTRHRLRNGVVPFGALVRLFVSPMSVFSVAETTIVTRD
jgi:hypothetical protein